MLEILSPAGNVEALLSAVRNGADAVYLGLQYFNARMKADNFTTQNLKQHVNFCHLYGVKVYVTLNTLVKDDELDLLDDILVSIGEAKADAIILTDLAVLAKAKKLCPHVALHASTQMSVHNYLGALALQKLGFSRVVLSRECKIEDIEQIKHKTNLEIEYFVHGAMCVSFSGQCLLSGISGGNSGNRGLCLQPCRKQYYSSLTDGKGYFISPKDQCLIDYIDKLKNVGVDSLKIEGRLKSAEYVGLVTAKYRKAVDGKSLSDADYSELKRVYNRGGFCNGYAFSPKNQIIYPLAQNHIGEQIGVIKSCTKAKNYYKLVVVTNSPLTNGDGVKILRGGREVGGFEVSIIEQNNNVYKLYSKHAYEAGDEVNITFDKNLAAKYSTEEMPKIPVDISVKLTENKFEVTANCRGKQIEYSEFVELEQSRGQGTTADEIKKQITKCGNTPFCVGACSVILQPNLFVPKSIINNLRRDFFEYLQRTLEEVYSADSNGEAICSLDKKLDILCAKPANIVISDKIDFDAVKQQSIINFVVNYNNFDEIALNYAKNHNNLFVRLPKIAFRQDLSVIENWLSKLPQNVGIYAENLYSVYLASVSKRAVICGVGLNIMNSMAAEVLGLDYYVASPELSGAEIKSLSGSPAVYCLGYLPVMNFCHCPITHFSGCSCANCAYEDYSIKDNYGEYKVRRTKTANCYFEMLNSSCHMIEHSALPQGCYAQLDLTELASDSAKAAAMVNDYFDGVDMQFSADVKLTRGHYLRGVK